ncbi:Uncharacterised protein [Bordetella pertussis]|nr:Uncharacterised protein [Bordetella pertussis]CPK81956.1 Uncharacterised protein [Bordetella pertussis]CPL74595.1 Uncharacterised protein [Bordetella pertussis]CPO45764.1 Uncharacterised protein [Bordetella pertussis]
MPAMPPTPLLSLARPCMMTRMPSARRRISLPASSDLIMGISMFQKLIGVQKRKGQEKELGKLPYKRANYCKFRTEYKSK